MRQRRPAWSLLELMVASAILGVLFALAMVAVNKLRESANRTVCLDNLRQLALAVHSYHGDHHELPPYATMTPKSPIFGGWWLHIMPYVAENDLYDKIAQKKHPIVHTKQQKMVLPPVQQKEFREMRFPLLTCPSDPSTHLSTHWVGTSNYLADWYVLGNGVKGCYDTEARRFQDIANGVSNTVLFAEGYSHCGKMVRPALTVCCSHNFGITPDYLPSDAPKYLPLDYTMFQIKPPLDGPAGCDYWRTQSPHENMPVALVDGSGRFIESGISPAIWKRIIKPDDGGVVDE